MAIHTFILIVILHWYAALFLHTFYYHRYFTHEQFTMSKFWERFFYGACILIQGSSSMNPQTYRKVHLAHHDFSDTDKDPHSPWNFKNVIAMMLRTLEIFREIKDGTSELVRLYKDKEMPSSKHFHRIADSMTFVMFFIGVYIFLYATFAPVWWLWFLLPITIFSTATQGAIVNWCGHKYGYRNFNTNDNSRNTPVAATLMFGEAYQNNHHQYPNSPNFGKKWHEFDFVYWCIMRPLNYMHVIRLKLC